MTALNTILDDEFLRSNAGLRVFSVGILGLCRKLGLKLGTGGVSENPARETLAVAWMLDLGNPVEAIKAACESPAILQEILDAYEFTLCPSRLRAVQLEIERVGRAIEASAVSIAPKPGATGAPPPGN